VQQVAAKGTTFFANNESGIRLAAEIVEAVPCAEKVRFVSTGSEADLYAMRLARAYSNRDKILKFEGGYHGMSDYGLMSLAPKRAGNFPQPIPDSAGIPKSVRDEVLVAPFNDLETVASLIREHKSELAGIIVEPFQRLIPPATGFLAGLRKLTQDNGLLLIFD
jgi:glutamate-1-semialdehyde 2,1-aminomutase